MPDVLFIEPVVSGDDRGFFFESFNQRQFEAVIGRSVSFVQDNHSRSRRNVLRGLHYQIKQPQAKLLRVIEGEIFDVVVDMRRSSATYGKSASAILSAQNKKQIWIPEGFAHGFYILSESAEVLYKASDYWSAEHERCVAWNDPQLAVDWPMARQPLLSPKDKKGVSFSRADAFP